MCRGYVRLPGGRWEANMSAVARSLEWMEHAELENTFKVSECDTIHPHTTRM